MNPFPKEWSDIYVCLESNDINNVDLIYNICIKNNPIINIDYYIFPILQFAIETCNIDILEWLSNLEIFNIDIFEPFLIAAECGQIYVIMWGLLKGYELKTHHVLHAIKYGKLEVLEFAVVMLKKLNPTVNTDYYISPILHYVIENGHIAALEWLYNIEIINIESFQLFLLASECGQLDVIIWGILKGYELMPQHVLHAVKHGKLGVLEFAVDNVEEAVIFYNDLFINTAIEYDHFNIIRWYKEQGIPI